jgi:hypothetical protein
MEPMTEAKQRLAEYLLSEEYRPLLYAAVLARYGTTSRHHEQHLKAIDLIEAAFPVFVDGVMTRR